MALKSVPLLASAITASLALSVLTACEQGVLLRDTSKSADFKVETQIPGEKAGVTGETEISLSHAEIPKALNTTSEGADEAAAGQWESSIGIQIKTPAHETENSYKINFQAQAGKFTSGKVQTREGDPLMSWRAICSDKDCSNLYIAAMLQFNDDKGTFRESKVLMVGIYREQKEVKRYIFGYEERFSRFSEIVKVLESMDPEKTRVQILETLNTNQADNTADAEKDVEVLPEVVVTPTASAGEATGKTGTTAIATDSNGVGQSTSDSKSAGQSTELKDHGKVTAGSNTGSGMENQKWNQTTSESQNSGAMTSELDLSTPTVETEDGVEVPSLEFR